MAVITICSDLGAQKIESDTVSTVSPSISHEVMGPYALATVNKAAMNTSVQIFLQDCNFLSFGFVCLGGCLGFFWLHCAAYGVLVP